MREGFRKQHYGCSKNQMANVVSSGVSIPQQVLQEQRLCCSRWKHGLYGMGGGEGQEGNGHGSADGARYLEVGKLLLTWPGRSPRVPMQRYRRRSTLLPARVGLRSCLPYTTEQDHVCPPGHRATAARPLLMFHYTKAFGFAHSLTHVILTWLRSGRPLVLTPTELSIGLLR